MDISKKIVTNLRIEENDWLQIKAEAGELGISVNEYINNIIKTTSIRVKLALDKNIYPNDKRSIWNLADLAKIQGKPMDMSDEDKVIYGE